MSRRADQAYVTASVTFRGETRDLGVFNTWEGGGKTSDDTKVRRGGTRVRRALGGVSNTENVTIGRDYDLARDHANIHWLLDAVGQGRVTFNKFFTDDNDQPYGRPMVYTGVLVGCTPPGHDIESSDLAVLELEGSMDSPVG
jgi:hypothetical protein